MGSGKYCIVGEENEKKGRALFLACSDVQRPEDVWSVA